MAGSRSVTSLVAYPMALPNARPALTGVDGRPSRRGLVASVNVSAGGVPKRAIERARVRESGMEGDRQRNLKYHGGPSRALCLYSLELIAILRAEGHPIGIGTTGENLTLSGIDWALMVPGVALRAGEAELELTAYAPPCRVIADSFTGRRLGRISEQANAGWSRLYAKVRLEGAIWRGSVVMLLP